MELEEVALATPDVARPSAEELFIERLKAGDEAAFDRLITEGSGDVYALLYRLTQDPEEARDLTQETFLRAFQHIGRFRGDADLKTWIYRIAINQARNRWRWWRRRRRDVTVSLDAEDDGRSVPLSGRLAASEQNNPLEETLAHEREDRLNAALATLNSSYREAVVLRDIEGMSYEEIAVALGINIGTVKSRLARGRLELRRRLGSSL